MIQLADYIGKPAMFEQFAEECIEAAHAAMKYARYMRDENPCDESVTEDKLRANLAEEMADVVVCLRQMDELGFNEYLSIIDEKEKRMLDRLIVNEAKKKAEKMKTTYLNLGEISGKISAYYGEAKSKS